MLKKALIIAGTLAASAPLMAAEFIVPNSFEILVVNGEKPGSGGFFSNDKKITLPDEGTQQVVVRFRDQRGNDEGLVSSDPQVLKFSTNGLTKIEIEKPRLRGSNSIDKYADAPVIKLHDASGSPVEFAHDVLARDGYQIGRNFTEEVSQYNKAGTGVAAISVGTVAVASQPAPVAKKAESTAVANDTAVTSQLENVRQAFQQLTEEEKKAFVQWAVSEL